MELKSVKFGDLTNKVIVVTGSNKGIGLSIVKSLLENGAYVYSNFRTETPSDKLVQLSKQYPEKLELQFYDVRDEIAVSDALKTIWSKHKKIDGLINNAGIITYELIPFIDFKKFDEMIQVNIVATVKMTQLVSRFMSKNKRGSIINISSIVSNGVSGQLTYSATKGAVNSITLSSAKEFAKNGIRVNAISPGMVATERLVQTMEDKFSEKIQNIGLGRLAEPEEIADLCVFLSSDNSSYITGQIIGIDGGLII